MKLFDSFYKSIRSSMPTIRESEKLWCQFTQPEILTFRNHKEILPGLIDKN